jgi:putative ABC transport system substrate-binding protein
MRRIGLAVALIINLLAALPTARAQQVGKVWRIGLFHVGLDHVPPSLDGLRDGLKALGYEEGKNLHLDWRNLPDEAAARETARQFVRQHVDLIVAFESQTVRAAKAATTEIPVIFLHVTDPVVEGFVQSLSHPGGNLTGFAEFFAELAPKRLELLKELIPKLHSLLILIGPDDPAAPLMRTMVREACLKLGLESTEQDIRTRDDLERIFRSIRSGQFDAVFLATLNLHTNFPSLIVQLSREKRLAVAFHRKEWVVRGALLSYGVSFRTQGEEAARYVDRILKGGRPSDIPVERPTKLELVINLKTAKALGLTIPQTLLLRADQVIE